MAKQKFKFGIAAVVEVEIDDSLVPDDDWRKQFYGNIHTLKDVASMFAYNACANGVTRINVLDGFADRKATDARVAVEWDEPEELE